MDLKGKHTLEASRQEVWDILMDTDALVRITPGVTKLEETEKDKYKAVSEVSIGPVSGSFSGELELTEKTPPEVYILKVSQNSKIGNVKAEVKISLEEISGDRTELSFNGEAKMSGLLSRTGQRVMKGVANSLTKQFFEALDKEVKKTE